MYTLINTEEQLAQLRDGNLITKYYGVIGTSPDVFDKDNSIAYRINKINATNQMIELIGVEDPFIILFSPGHLNRMFIRSSDLLIEGNWWLTLHTLNL
ncbi:hypothetical protein [Taibaiella helva]|uniref:hypothetical protein n=1 Tax=Taibaiella helva TaxID=2301235 RepID=UPI000E590588|nr:hypothetical protein [Taibaiella helva]